MGLTDYSSPNTVYRKAKELYGSKVVILPSTRKDKKYMLLDPESGKYIHFGQMGYEDYTKHKDELRQENFLKRNAQYKNAGKYTAGFMAYHLLW